MTLSLRRQLNNEKLSLVANVYESDTARLSQTESKRANVEIRDSKPVGKEEIGEDAEAARMGGLGAVLSADEAARKAAIFAMPAQDLPPSTSDPSSKTGSWFGGRAVVPGGAGLGEPSQTRAEQEPEPIPANPAPDDDRKLTFEQIHKKYETKIFNLILRIVGDREDAEDLTVETFVNAYRAWDRFRGEARVSTWLHQIAVNNCKNRFKQRDRRREREPVSLDDNIETDSGELVREVADWRAVPEQTLLDKEFAGRLQKAVDALKPDYKVVFILSHYDNLPYEDIAKATNLSVPAVKTRLHRARNMVRQRLEPYYKGY